MMENESVLVSKPPIDSQEISPAVKEIAVVLCEAKTQARAIVKAKDLAKKNESSVWVGSVQIAGKMVNIVFFRISPMKDFLKLSKFMNILAYDMAHVRVVVEVTPNYKWNGEKKIVARGSQRQQVNKIPRTPKIRIPGS